MCGGGVIKRSFETGSHNVVQVDFELVASLLSQYPSLLLWEGGPDKMLTRNSLGEDRVYLAYSLLSEEVKAKTLTLGKNLTVGTDAEAIADSCFLASSPLTCWPTILTQPRLICPGGYIAHSDLSPPTSIRNQENALQKFP